MSSKQKLAKGMIMVLVANMLSMTVNVVLNFIQPKFLSVDTYGAIKTFALYMSCAGVFHLGYEDGMYIRYGGKDTGRINKNELCANISTLRIFQAVISLFVFLVGLLIKNPILAIFALFLLPYNMTMYYRLLFQATGEFTLYSRILRASAIVLFGLNAILLFAVKTDNYQFYLIVYVIVYLAVWIVLEEYVRKTIEIQQRLLMFSLTEFVDSIKSGFLIMIGNFSSIFLTSMSRWFVKFLFDSVTFAIFSFAVSMENMLNVAVTPFTVTLFNYFCQETEEEKIIRMRNSVCIFAILIVSAAFPAKFIIDIWLPHYIEAENAILYLFTAQIFFIIIKSIYVNLYKAQKRQKEYFAKLIIVLVTGVIFQIICFYYLRTKEAMAIGTLASAIVWFILCQLDYKNLCYDMGQCIYIAVEIIVFNATYRSFSAITGFVIYVLFSITFSFLVLKNDCIYIFREIKSIVQKRSRSIVSGN